MWRIGAIPYRDKGLQYLPLGYLRGLKHIGASPVVLRYETPLEEVPAIVRRLDGMLFTGGVDIEPGVYGAYREMACGSVSLVRDSLEFALFGECMRLGLPIFGICRGCQLINVAMGGTLTQDIPTRYGTVHQMSGEKKSAFMHDVRVVRGTRLYEATGGDLAVDSYHHQCVRRLADGLVPAAYAPEGFIEAFESAPGAPYLLAVQWHPEITLGDDMASVRLFEMFGRAIERYRQSS